MLCKIFGHKYIQDGIKYRCKRCNAILMNNIVDMNIDVMKLASALIENDKTIREMRIVLNIFTKRISNIEYTQNKIAADIEKLKKNYNQLVEFLENKG